MLRINTDCNPLEENHNNQVAKDTKQKQDLHTKKQNNHSCVVFIKKRVRISCLIKENKFITFTSFVSKHTTTLAQLNLYKVFTLGYWLSDTSLWLHVSDRILSVSYMVMNFTSSLLSFITDSLPKSCSFTKKCNNNSVASKAP